jgi:hypothetical protein
MSTHNMAQTSINNALEQTNLSLGQVANTISTHGDLILSRWSKKSKNRNRDVLGAANNLPSWLQIEDLIEDRMKLISLLHVRTTFSSEHWTTFDAVESEASFVGQEEGEGPFGSDYVQICGAHFGRVVGFELDAALNRTMLSFSRAHYIFTKQTELANALLTIVNAIVAGAAPSGNEKWLALVNTDVHGVGVQLDSYEGAGFMPPVNGLDVDALLQTCLDKRNQMVDEVELLQTDPEYTRDHVLALKADIRWDAKVPSDLKWNHVAGRFVTEAIAELNVWHDIVLTCEELRNACQLHEGATVFLPGATLSTEVTLVLTELRQLLYGCTRFQWEDLYTSITQMHAAKDLYRMCSAGGKLVPCRRIIPPGAPQTPSDRIHKAFCDLATAMNVRHGSKSTQFNALAEQLSAVQFDERVHKCLLTLIQLEALHLSLDWSQTTPRRLSAGLDVNELFDDNQSTSEDFFVETRHAEIDPSRRESYEILTSGQPHPKWKPLGPLLRALCDNSLPKSDSGALWLAKATEARQHLTTFWQTARDIMRADRKKQEPTDERYPALLRDSFSFDVDSDHLASLEEEREEIEAEEQKLRDVAASKHAKGKGPADAQQTTWGEEAASSSNEPAKEKAAKPKANQLTSEELDLLQIGLDDLQVAEVLEQQQLAVPAKVHIAVKQDYLSVFRKMFGSTASTPIRWIQFVQALTDAGMTVSQVPGSGVKFTYGKRGVIFDKPHPEPVVSAKMIRRAGRRLAKWFKWDAETFVVRVKEEQQQEADLAE